jgi:hypothetical protein
MYPKSYEPELGGQSIRLLRQVMVRLILVLRSVIYKGGMPHLYIRSQSLPHGSATVILNTQSTANRGLPQDSHRPVLNFTVAVTLRANMGPDT